MSSASKAAWRKDPANRAAENERRKALALPAYKPRAPKGLKGAPPVPHLHEGLELAGQSVFTNKDGAQSHWDLGRRHPVKGAPIPKGLLPKRMSVHVRSDGHEYGRHIAFEPSEVERWEAFERAVARLTAGIEPLCPIEAPAHVDEDYLGMLNLGDLHLGMLAWDKETGASHDLKIATRDLRIASRIAIDRAPPAARFLIVNQGDLFHAQDNNQKTPRSGHKLDVDGRFDKIFDVACVLLRDMIDHALTRFGSVRFVGIPGNHDPHTPHMVASHLAAWYRLEPRVTIDPSHAPFAYEEFGLNLLGFAHGPSVTRIERLKDIMVVDQAEAWGRCKRREWHIGDIHHVTAREFAGVTVWSHGILPPKDAWTHESGYRAEQRMSQTTYHRKYGRRRCEWLSLEEVRDMQEAGAL